ncbi:GNAT family N-acetyltransferase [Marinilactibacillus kalidii]|uniref:GNAT family N-acetyltransferase n=1 Tax=Marinilactibacillus kalidii TaxID=2820274 RepID=UPI001ABDA334|nr:GNAT family N-acetyltransferase [Marinilactibacillus kalidii]
MNLKIRKIQQQDNQKMGEIVQRNLEKAGLAIPGTAYFDPYLFQLSTIYLAERSDYWVMKKNHKIIGGGGYGPFGHHKTTGELQKLYIIEEEQGQGYAHLLMRTILEEAGHVYEEIYIETFASLAVANTLYLKYGFEKLDQPLDGSEHGACDTWLLKSLYK